ncbi:hypothetical protein NAT51_17615 [Flavobacterium amniphilum]|uniref:hypothetical protein n=1 Tax=Flavobacterium amniphilum TaxID=1834035 RepID=UPI00202A8E28|nr:hypothetical protein [Flavobacterium amniphilum]MCL9807350.1 hypothetical protein [Flavobacterium amniphilum]
MKKLATTLVMIMIVSMNGFSQETRERKTEKTPLSAEQRNQLRLKRMTLELDLSASQQKEMAAVIADQSAKREAKMAEFKKQGEAKKELTADEKFTMKSQMLDEQIAHKAKMKKILNEKQFEKWEANSEKRQHKMHKIKRGHKQKNDVKDE